MAFVAKEYKLSRPILGPFPTISQSRHLLQEMFVSDFIPNDFMTRKKVTILTGPNSSGKSIFMKQFGIMQYLGQIGSFIPAEMAQIVSIDRLLTRIKTKESTGSNESTFSTELKQIKGALECATGNSLILVDEFGKGTRPEDGIALLVGFVKYLLEIPEESRPWTIIITHFTEIYGLVSSSEDIEINWMKMDVVEQRGQVIYKYKAVEGKSNSSFAVQCARRAGISERILRRAEEINKLMETDSSSSIIKLFNQQKFNKKL
jgi:DNA mismatch repair protein MSH5